MADNSCLLVRTPAPHSNESLLGYVLRVSEENGYQSLIDIARLTGMGVEQIQTRHLRVRKLAPILGLNLHELDEYSYLSEPENKNSKFKLKHHDLGGRAFGYQFSKNVRICPLCIAEDGFVDAFWDLAISIACPRHSIKAIFDCHACNSKIEWSRPGLLSCKCGANYSDAILERADVKTVELMQIIYAKTHDKTLLDLIQTSQYPLEKFEDIELGQFLRMLHTFTFLSDGYQQAYLIGEFMYTTNAVNCFGSIFSNWPNGFIHYLQKVNKLTQLHWSSNNFWKKFRNIYRVFSQSSWFNRRCNFISDELISFGLNNMRGSLCDLIEVEPKNQNLFHIPLAKRFKYEDLAEEHIQQLVWLKHIFTNLGAARHLGLPQKVLLRLDNEGMFNEFSVAECYKSPDHPWNGDELHKILLRLKKIAENGKSKGLEPARTVHLGKLLVKDTLDIELKVSIVRDILKQKIVVHDMAGLNFSGLILDRDVLAKYIFHRCPKNYRSSLSVEDASLKLKIPRLVVDSLIYLGMLTAIKSDSGMRVMQKSISEFSEKFIGKDLLVKLLYIGEYELAQRIERESIPSFNIPFGDGFERYPFIQKKFIPKLAGSH